MPIIMSIYVAIMLILYVFEVITIGTSLIITILGLLVIERVCDLIDRI